MELLYDPVGQRHYYTKALVFAPLYDPVGEDLQYYARRSRCVDNIEGKRMYRDEAPPESIIEEAEARVESYVVPPSAS
jgi:hypothetical protein